MGSRVVNFDMYEIWFYLGGFYSGVAPIGGFIWHMTTLGIFPTIPFYYTCDACAVKYNIFRIDKDVLEGAALKGWVLLIECRDHSHETLETVVLKLPKKRKSHNVTGTWP